MSLRTNALRGLIAASCLSSWSHEASAAVTGNGALRNFGNGANTGFGNGASSGFGNGASHGFANGASKSYGNGASRNFGNGASVKFPNGASVNFPNGAKTSFPNGAKTSFPNGASMNFGNGANVSFPNGANVTYPNGANTQYNGANTNYGNGANVSYPNGASVKFPNGASLSLPPGTTVTFPNGAEVTFPPPTSVTITVPEDATITFPNGANVSFPNGASTIENGFSTQAFLTSNLLRYPTLTSVSLMPNTWQTLHASLYNYLVAALKAANGHLTSNYDDGISAYADPYDLIAFKYLIQSAASSGTDFTVSYVHNLQPISMTFHGGLGLCQSLPLVYGQGSESAFFNNTSRDVECGYWVAAATAVWTQPTGINNMISITNLTASDPGVPAGKAIRANPSSSLALVSQIGPMPRKRGVAMDPWATTDVRAVESMEMSQTGSSGTYTASSPNTQGGWAGLWALRCTGGQTVTFNLKRKQASATLVPGTSVAYNATNLIFRVTKGVHGANKNEQDWVADFATSSNASWVCGTGFSEVATADRANFRFVYSVLVRSGDGNDTITKRFADDCYSSPSSCLGNATYPPATTADALPATEAQIFTQRESYNYGGAFFGLVKKMNPTTGTSELVREYSSNLWLAESCDARSVAATGSMQLWNPSTYNPTSGNHNFVNFSYTEQPYLTYEHSPMTNDRLTYKREYCSSLRSDKCVSCVTDVQGGAFIPDLRAPDGQYQPFQVSTGSSLYTVKVSTWANPPQFSNEASTVDRAYYAGTRVCAQSKDYTNQGYCFGEYACLAGDPECTPARTVTMSTSMTGYGEFVSASYPGGPQAGLVNILKVSLPQPVQPITTPANLQCPVGYTKNAAGRCFALLATGTSCQDNMQCSSGFCTAGFCSTQFAFTSVSQTTTSFTMAATRANDNSDVCATSGISSTVTGTNQAWTGDLGATRTIRQIRITPPCDGTYLTDVAVQVSTNNSTWTTIDTISTTPLRTGTLTIQPRTTTSARYVRLFKAASGTVRLAEVDVFGQ